MTGQHYNEIDKRNERKMKMKKNEKKKMKKHEKK